MADARRPGAGIFTPVRIVLRASLTPLVTSIHASGSAGLPTFGAWASRAAPQSCFARLIDPTAACRADSTSSSSSLSSSSSSSSSLAGASTAEARRPGAGIFTPVRIVLRASLTPLVTSFQASGCDGLPAFGECSSRAAPQSCFARFTLAFAPSPSPSRRASARRSASARTAAEAFIFGDGSAEAGDGASMAEARRPGAGIFTPVRIVFRASLTPAVTSFQASGDGDLLAFGECASRAAPQSCFARLAGALSLRSASETPSIAAAASSAASAAFERGVAATVAAATDVVGGGGDADRRHRRQRRRAWRRRAGGGGSIGGGGGGGDTREHCIGGGNTRQARHRRRQRHRSLAPAPPLAPSLP